MAFVQPGWLNGMIKMGLWHGAVSLNEYLALKGDIQHKYDPGVGKECILFTGMSIVSSERRDPEIIYITILILHLLELTYDN